jgi:hypothetical protein
VSEKTAIDESNAALHEQELTDEQLVQVWTNVAPQHPALSRVHEKLNKSSGVEEAITSYDRMHHRHNR